MHTGQTLFGGDLSLGTGNAGVTLDRGEFNVLKAGVIVVSATAGTFDSDSGGLEPGDVIHAVNGHWIMDLAALRAALDPMPVGDSVVLQVQRRSSLIYMAFTIE